MVRKNPKPDSGVRFRICLAASCRLCANFEFQIKNDAEIVHGNEYYEPVFRVRSIMAESPKINLKYFE